MIIYYYRWSRTQVYQYLKLWKHRLIIEIQSKMHLVLYICKRLANFFFRKSFSRYNKPDTILNYTYPIESGDKPQIKWLNNIKYQIENKYYIQMRTRWISFSLPLRYDFCSGRWVKEGPWHWIKVRIKRPFQFWLNVQICGKLIFNLSVALNTMHRSLKSTTNRTKQIHSSLKCII